MAPSLTRAQKRAGVRSSSTESLAEILPNKRTKKAKVSQVTPSGTGVGKPPMVKLAPKKKKKTTAAVDAEITVAPASPPISLEVPKIDVPKIVPKKKKRKAVAVAATTASPTATSLEVPKIDVPKTVRNKKKKKTAPAIVAPPSPTVISFDFPIITLKDDPEEVPSETRLYVCKDCPFTTKYPGNLSSHRKNMHSQRRCRYSCSLCGNTSFYTRTVKTHIKNKCPGAEMLEEMLDVSSQEVRQEAAEDIVVKVEFNQSDGEGSQRSIASQTGQRKAQDAAVGTESDSETEDVKEQSEDETDDATVIDETPLLESKPMKVDEEAEADNVDAAVTAKQIVREEIDSDIEELSPDVEIICDDADDEDEEVKTKVKETVVTPQEVPLEVARPVENPIVKRYHAELYFNWYKFTGSRWEEFDDDETSPPELLSPPTYYPHGDRWVEVHQIQFQRLMPADFVPSIEQMHPGMAATGAAGVGGARFPQQPPPPPPRAQPPPSSSGYHYKPASSGFDYRRPSSHGPRRPT